MPFAFRPLRSNEYPAGLYDRITMLCGFFLVVLLLNYPSDYQLIFLNPKRLQANSLAGFVEYTVTVKDSDEESESYCTR